MAFDVPFDVPHGTCVTALQPIVRQLERDMAQWQIGKIDRRLLQRLYANISESAVHAAIGIINRTVYYLRPLGQPRSAMLVSAVHDLQEAADAHPLPDVELMLNADDYPRVWRRSGRTALPVFSFVQTSSTADIVCPSGSFRESNYDSLLLGSAVYEEAFPWTSKSPVAFWRGTPFCGRHFFGRCSRYLLTHLTAQNTSELLDAGLTSYEPTHDPYLRSLRSRSSRLRADLPQPAKPLLPSRRLDIRQHPRYKMLLHLDGHTASSRLQALLATNSVVIKQSSYFWEYYYAGLQPHKHFLPFWQEAPTDVLGVLRNVSRPEYDGHLRRVATTAQQFAHHHLKAHARECYWRALLHCYARRLATPPQLSYWPRARAARGNYREGWHDPASLPISTSLQNNPGRFRRESRQRAALAARARPRIDWQALDPGERQHEQAALMRFVASVEGRLEARLLSRAVKCGTRAAGAAGGGPAGGSAMPTAGADGSDGPFDTVVTGTALIWSKPRRPKTTAPCGSGSAT